MIWFYEFSCIYVFIELRKDNTKSKINYTRKASLIIFRNEQVSRLYSSITLLITASFIIKTVIKYTVQQKFSVFCIQQKRERSYRGQLTTCAEFEKGCINVCTNHLLCSAATVLAIRSLVASYESSLACTRILRDNGPHDSKRRAPPLRTHSNEPWNTGETL